MWNLPPPDELRWSLVDPNQFRPAVERGAEDGLGKLEPMEGTRADLIEACVYTVAETLCGRKYVKISSLRFPNAEAFAGFSREEGRFAGKNALRKAIRQGNLLRAHGRSTSSETMAVLSDLCSQEDVERARQLFKALPPRERNAVRQHMIEGRAIRKVAERMKLTEKEVEGLIRSGLQKLQDALR